MTRIKTKRTCSNGHSFYKRKDCPTCTICEKEKKPEDGFLALLGSPARNALLNHGIDQLEKLTQYSMKDLLKLHGLGKASLPLLSQALMEKGLNFKE